MTIESTEHQESTNPPLLIASVVGSCINIPDVKIIIGNSEIVFEGKNEINIDEIAKVYFRLETYLKSNGYYI